jgi:hypothetical protein
MPLAAHDQGGAGPFHGALEPDTGRRGDGAEVVQIQDDQGKARAAGEQIGSAERYPQAAATAHPEQGGEIGARRGSRERIERIHPVHEGHLAALTAAPPVATTRSRDPGDEGQEQAAGSGGPGTDDLAEPARREHAEQAVDPFALPPWRR